MIHVGSDFWTARCCVRLQLKCWLMPGEEEERRRQIEEEKKTAAPPIMGGAPSGNGSAGPSEGAPSLARRSVVGRYASAGGFGAAAPVASDSGSQGGSGSVLSGLRPSTAFGAGVTAVLGAGSAPAMFKPPSAVFTPAAPAEDAAAEDFGPAESAASAAGGSRPTSKAGTPKAGPDEAATASAALIGGEELLPAGGMEVGAVEAAWGGQQQQAQGDKGQGTLAPAYEHQQQYGMQYESPEGMQYNEQYQEVDAVYIGGGAAGGGAQVWRLALLVPVMTASCRCPGPRVLVMCSQVCLRCVASQFHASHYQAALQDAEGGSAMEVRPSRCLL